TRARCDVLARFFAVATFQAVENPVVRPVFREVVQNINFPMVLTDVAGIPRAWKEIGIPADAIPDSVLERASKGGPIPPEVARIQAIVKRLDEINQPVSIFRAGKPGPLGFVHYGEPKLVQQLRWVPYIEFLAILMLLLFGYAGLRSLLEGEQRSL